MLGRIGDAVRTLRGHARPCYTCERRTQKLEAEWLEFQLQLTGYMEQMNAWAARQAKRDKRALGTVLEAPSVEIEAEAAAGGAVGLARGAHKAQLRRRVFGGG